VSDGRATFELVGLPEGFAAACTQALHSLDRLKVGVEGAAGTLDRLTSGFTGLAGALGAGVLGGLIDHAISAGVEIEHMADRVGMGTTALQQLAFAAKRSGIDTEGLEKGLKKLNNAIGEAASGQESAINLFKDLGVEIRDSAGNVRAAGDVIGDVAEKIKNTESPAERTRLAIAAFGREGTRLLPMLEKGRDGIQELRDEAERLGVVLDKDMIEEAKRAKAELGRLTDTIQADLTKAILKASPIIEAFSKKLRDAVVGLGELWDRFGASDATTSVDELGGKLADINAQLKTLRDQLEAAPVVEPGMIPDINAKIAELEARRASLRALTGKRQQTEAGGGVTPGGGDVGPSEEQATKVRKFAAELREMFAVGDKDRQAIEQITAKADELAKVLDPGSATAVRAVAKAFTDWKQSVIDARDALDNIQHGESAASWLGMDKANVFEGLKTVRSIDTMITDLRNGVAQLAKDGVPAEQIFQTIGDATGKFGEKLQQLKEQYKDQPAVLEKLMEAEKRWGSQGEVLRQDLDKMARGLGGFKEGEAQVKNEAGALLDKITGLRDNMTAFIDTSEGISNVWMPTLKNAGASVDTFRGDFDKLKPTFDDVNGKFVTATTNANNLAQALQAAALAAIYLNSVIGVADAGGSIPPGNF
jgi:uncharacterized phage infection (PIP) family protein YhgE